MVTKAPFIYDRPVTGDEFLNRERELHTLASRLYNGSSTLISGRAHIGKSSLLRQMKTPAIQHKYLGDVAKQFVFIFRDLHEIGPDYTPVTFWKEMLAPLRNCSEYATIAHLPEGRITKDARRSLERLFERYGRQGQRLVLLLDEFERLWYHINFRDRFFFTSLQACTTRTDGLVVISTSRLSLYELNKQGRTLLPGAGSPLFNNMTELPLGPFSEETVNLLLDRGGFTPSERVYIRRMAGHHPFLLQACAASVAEERAQGEKIAVSQHFYERVAFHFDEFWDTLDLRTRLAVVILSLLQLGKCFSRQFHVDTIEQLKGFGRELQHLARLGLAEQLSIEMELDWHAYTWHGEQWRVSAQAFTWWVWEVIVVQNRKVPSVDQWLAWQDYRFLLTQAEWDDLVSRVRNAGLSTGCDLAGERLFSECS